MLEQFGPFIGNTHTETNVTGTSMTLAYKEAKNIIRRHVNADENDAVISAGSGMTGALLKLQRMLGLKIPAAAMPYIKIPDEFKPVVFITHMEHHSNHTTWLETVADVEIINPDKNGLPDLDHLHKLIEHYKNKKIKIASVTSCSNVTGIITPYHEIAEIVHSSGDNSYCFVDFACSAPYIPINMHPEKDSRRLDAIFFSPHKFLGGPGTSGILVFNKKLYNTFLAPDQPGGGTVKWTNPWKEHRYYDDIESREDGGTPPFLQTIKTAMCIKLKEELNPELMKKREEFFVKKIFGRLRKISNLHLLANNCEKRLMLFPFYIDDLHYNLAVKLLNDRFGIQVRGGCSCAGTYGHFLLNVSQEVSHKITKLIDKGDLSEKPGWVRVSLHPVMPEEEIDFIIDSIGEIAVNHQEWSKDYKYHNDTNYYTHNSFPGMENEFITDWFRN
jgi:selenocysteine lyase/cysteine desulfurase